MAAYLFCLVAMATAAASSFLRLEFKGKKAPKNPKLSRKSYN
jgi:hypothetical protein